MSETLVAALIAAAATVSASLLQLKVALTKELAARTGGSSRRKSRLPVVLIFILMIASAVGGFAIARWMNEDERVEQNTLRRELEARISEIGHTATQLELTRNGARAEIEQGVLRRLGEEGVATLATIGACKPASVGVPTSAAASTTACAEPEATPISLCTSLPAQAKVLAIELFSRPADAAGDWSSSRVAPGQEVERARFSDAPLQVADGETSKHLCHTFVYWGSDRARSARMLVRYTLPSGATPSP